MTFIESSYEYVCDNCLEDYYTYCDECGNWVDNEYITTAISADGEEINVCTDCLENSYYACEDCGKYVHENIAEEIEGGYFCPECQHNHEEENEEGVSA